jgi:hypothetical protein
MGMPTCDRTSEGNVEVVRAFGTCGPSDERFEGRCAGRDVSGSMRVDTGDVFSEVEGREDVRNGKEMRDLREVLLLLCFADASCRAVAESRAILRNKSVPLALSVDEVSFAVVASMARFAYSALDCLAGSPCCELSSLSDRGRVP